MNEDRRSPSAIVASPTIGTSRGRTARESYAAPEVTLLGTVAEITLAGGSVTATDGITARKTTG